MEDSYAPGPVMVAMVKEMIWDVTHRLIAGNDTQCFSTKQYEEARDEFLVEKAKWAGLKNPTAENIGLTKLPIKYARDQLQGCPYLVQVKPDVWTLKELVSPE